MIESADMEQITQLVKSTVAMEVESVSRNDVDDEGIRRADIAFLGPNATDIQILNKINELINSFNKTLRDNRI